MGFKLGHRRVCFTIRDIDFTRLISDQKLQRAIAESRGQPLDKALHLEHGKVAAADGYQSDDSMQDVKESSGQATPSANPSAVELLQGPEPAAEAWISRTSASDDVPNWRPPASDLALA